MSPAPGRYIRLIRSQLFENMFRAPHIGQDFDVPIQTFLPTDDLYALLEILSNQEYRTALHTRQHETYKIYVPSAISTLCLADKLALTVLSDRFDCEVISILVKRSLDLFYACTGSIVLLTEASMINSIQVAKIAIEKMENNHACQNLSYTEWRGWARSLRPIWQIELSVLLWELQYRIVNRPNEIRQRKPNGRLVPREPEKVVIRTNKSYKEMAAAFNPASEVSHDSVRSSCSGQVGGGLAKSYDYSICASLASTFPYSNAMYP